MADTFPCVVSNISAEEHKQRLVRINNANSPFSLRCILLYFIFQRAGQLTSQRRNSDRNNMVNNQFGDRSFHVLARKPNADAFHGLHGGHRVNLFDYAYDNHRLWTIT